MTTPLPSTVRTARRLEALEARVAAARGDRDAAIRDRIAEGATITAVAREVGLTRQAVYDAIGRVNQLDTETA